MEDRRGVPVSDPAEPGAVVTGDSDVAVPRPGRAPQIGVGVWNFAPTPPPDWRHVLDQARAAEDAGIDRILVNDHLAFGGDLSAYADPRSGGQAGGKQPTGPDGDWLEPLTLLAALAAVTSKIHLATNVLIAPLRQPVLLAKVAATLDALSQGRFELGVGTGWQEVEYDAVGVDFALRGRVLDETLAACRALWSQREASYEGRHVSFSDLHMMPKPLDPAGVPLWIGGRAIPAAARRIATHGAGWIPWGQTGADVATFAEQLDRMSMLLSKEGADLAPVPVAYHLRPMVTDSGRLDLPRTFELLPELWDLGVADFRLMFPLPREYAPARELLEDVRSGFDGVLDANL